MLQQVSSCLRLWRLHLATRRNAVIKIPSQGIADLAHLAADGIDLLLEGVHLGCHEAVVNSEMEVPQLIGDVAVVLDVETAVWQFAFVANYSGGRLRGF